MPGPRHATARFGALLRRNPGAVRNTALGAIASGAVLFVIASITTPLAGADTAPSRQAHRSPAAAAYPALQDLLPLSPAQPVAGPPAAVKPLTFKAAHRKAAPVSTALISEMAANGIPATALNAYRVAAARMANTDPGCGIDWALLAGIGREESDHGQFGGAVLHTDGTSTPRIIGIPLDGHGTAAIRDTDGGRLDGDPVWDRAVGPMQFIPSTWALYGVDANGDGKADPFNINDAALTAARYLCAAGGNLRTHAGQVAAVLSYNHSDQYLAQVLALANAYRNGIPISGIPIGNITGKLPKVHGGTPPPANPGPPPAAGKTAPAKKTSTPASKLSSSKPGRGSGSGNSGSPAPGGSSSHSSRPPSGTPTSTPPSSTPAPSPSGTPTCTVPNPLDPAHCLVP